MLPSLGLAAALAVPAAAAAPVPPSVILITLTNVGARRTSLHGYERDTTPRLARWSRGALVFEEAFAPASWTLPSATTLHTGLQPASHGVWSRTLSNSVSTAAPTLAERFGEAGYRTALFAAGLDYNPRFSHLRGFQFKARNHGFTPFARTLAQAREWLDAYGARPFFLAVQGYDAHCPFVSAPPQRGVFAREEWRTLDLPDDACARGIEAAAGGYEALYTQRCPDIGTGKPCSRQARKVRLTEGDMRYLSARYDETILQADAAVADFLESLPAAVAASALIVVTAEHGEMFAKNGRFGRSGSLRGAHFDEVLHVPLLVRLPGVPGRRVRGLVELADVAPSLLDWAGLPPLPDADGRSLRPLVEDGRWPRAFTATSLPYNLLDRGEARQLFPGYSLSESIRERDWKLLRERIVYTDGRPAEDRVELYRVSSDPDETRDLSAGAPDQARRLAGLLDAWRGSLRLRGTAGATPLPPELLRAARERGYWD